MGDQHPGVFIEEVPGSPRPIAGVGTSTAGFVGMAGAPWAGSYVRSRLDFARVWPLPSAVADAVEQYFLNGGSAAQVSSVEELEPRAVHEAISAMDRDVSVVAVIADPAPSARVIAAAAEALASRRAILLVEGPWADAPAAIAAMSAGAAALGAAGPDVAVYWPRLRRDRGDGVVTEVSPLGAVAGVFARTDAERGVFIAPAGLSTSLRGVREPAARARAAEQDELNALGVNLIRTFPQSGTVVWGARTQSRDDEWKYVPVRRLFLFIEESIDRGLEWVVFEPNGAALWQRVRAAIEDFLLTLWQQGALQGATSDEAFFVKCDRTTMTQDDLDSGRLVCTVGIAPAQPTEFVIFAIGAWTADADPDRAADG